MVENVTKDQKKLIDASWEIDSISADQANAIGYMSRALTSATIPHRDPKAESFTRENGNIKLRISDLSGNGLPYGSYPRLILAWITTEAVRTKSCDIVLGESLSEFMRQLGIVPTGGRWGSITALKSQIIRLFGSGFSVSYETNKIAKGSQHILAEDYELWWHSKDPTQSNLFNSRVKLSSKFYEEIVTRPVPIDVRALKALKRSPMALDIYMWLTYRMSYLEKETAITWEQLQLQIGSGYGSDITGKKNFQRAFSQHLSSVKKVYPGVNASLIRGRLLLKPSPTHVEKLQ